MTTFSTREISTAQEATFCEFESALGSLTWSQRLPLTDCRVTLEQDRQTDESIQTRQNETRPGYLLPRKATIELDYYLPGANQVTTGALTSQWHYALLKDALGGGDSTEVGGTVSGGATATSLPFASATLLRGGGIRVGAKGDARADGQFSVVSTPIVTPATLLTAMAAVPNAADVLYAALNIYPAETGTAYRRFLVAWPGTGQQYALLGCQADGIAISWETGGLIKVTMKYRSAYWVRNTVSYPQVATLEECFTAPVAGGSVFSQTFGTATSALVAAEKMTFECDLGLSEIAGIATGNAYRTIIGFERTFCRPKLTMVLPWSTTYDANYDTDGADTTYKHILLTLSATAKRAVGIYLPRAFPIGPRPTVQEANGRLVQTISYQGRESTDATTELTRSAWRMFLS